MIQKGSILNVIDNSGGRFVKCIGIYQGFNSRYAFLGSKILISVKRLRKKRRKFSKVKKGFVTYGLIVQAKKKPFSNSNHTTFLNNSVVLLNFQNRIIGTRVFGVLPKFLRYTRYMRVISLSSGIR